MYTFILASSIEQSGGGTSNFQLWGVPIITGIAFYLLGVATAVYLKRPKLAVAGSGGGGSSSPTGFQENTIAIRNIPGNLGIGIGQTVIFGRRLHGRYWFGWPVMREPAKGCIANLYDDAGNFIAPLWWRDPDDSGKVQISIDLDSGQQVDLFLFAQRNDDLPNYYPYSQGPDANPIVPAVKFSGTKRFMVQLMYSDGRQKKNLKYTASINYRDGHMSISQGWH